MVALPIIESQPPISDSEQEFVRALRTVVAHGGLRRVGELVALELRGTALLLTGDRTQMSKLLTAAQRMESATADIAHECGI